MLRPILTRYAVGYGVNCKLNPDLFLYHQKRGQVQHTNHSAIIARLWFFTLNRNVGVEVPIPIAFNFYKCLGTEVDVKDEKNGIIDKTINQKMNKQATKWRNHTF